MVKKRNDISTAPAKNSVRQRVTDLGRGRALSDEDGELLKELCARAFAEIQPRDLIEEILLSDFICADWEVARYRRFAEPNRPS
jgi:hypothetical protein